MSNLPQQIARNQYVADGITTVYNYDFLILSANAIANDIAVYVTLAGHTPNPVGDIQLLNTAYTVQGVGNLTGGTITFQPGFTPPISSIVTVIRNMSVSIDTDFSVAQNFNGANLDAAFERVILIMQEYLTALMYTTLTFPVNAIIPTAYENVLPQLPNNYTWVGMNGSVVAVEIISQIPLNTLSSPFTLTNTAVTTTGAQLNYLNIAEGTTGTGNLVYSTGATLDSPTIVGGTFTTTTFSGVTLNSSTLNQPTINQPNIVGVTNGSNAAAGSVGEFKSSVIASGAAISLTTDTITNVTSISLTAGDWDVWGNVWFFSTGQACNMVAWTNSVSATGPDNSLEVQETLTAASGYENVAFTVPMLRYNITTTKTIYLTVNTNFGSSTLTVCGGIYARRVR